MAYVKIRGVGTKEIPSSEARALKDLWVQFIDKKIDNQLVESSELTFRLSEIVAVDTRWDQQAKDYSANQQQAVQEFERHRSRLLALVPAERAKWMKLAEIAWWAVSPKRMPDDVRAAIIERQTAFFEENPQRAYANPICYRDVIEKYRSVNDARNSLMVDAAMRLVERSLVEEWAY